MAVEIRDDIDVGEKDAFKRGKADVSLVVCKEVVGEFNKVVFFELFIVEVEVNGERTVVLPECDSDDGFFVVSTMFAKDEALADVFVV